MNEEEGRAKKEREILAYLQQRLKAKSIRDAIKPEALEEKKAKRNINCTFCKKTILLGKGYVSFKSQGEVRYKGKVLRTERMHAACLNRYLRPGVRSFIS